MIQHRFVVPIRMTLLIASTIVGFALAAWAWGPHPKITRAALARLGPDHPLARQLGAEANRLGLYCWMADWQRSLVVQSPGGAFYPDDYLLFPPRFPASIARTRQDRSQGPS
jgi:hypothetical protein